MLKHRLPLFESIAAVLAVAIVAVLTALPSPKADPARDARLLDEICLARTAVFRFRWEHSDRAGAIEPGRAGEDIALQLTGLTRNDGSTYEPLSGREDRWNGPYLRAIPVNPVNGLATIRTVPDGAPPVLNGTAGWVYQLGSGLVLPDLPGRDPRGVLYADY